MSPDLSGPFAGYGRTWRKRAGERRSKREGQDRIRVPAANPEPFPFQEERAPRNPHAGACRRPHRPPCGTSPTEQAEMKILAAAFGFSLNLRIFVLIIKRVIPRRDRQEGRRRRIAFRKERRCAHPAMPPKDGGKTDPARCSGRSGTPTNTGDYANDTIFRVDHQ